MDIFLVFKNEFLSILMIEFIFFISVFVLIISFLSLLKWRKVKKLVFTINFSEYQVFERVYLSSNKHYSFKQIYGFPIKGKILINNKRMIFLPVKWSLPLFHTELPFLLNKEKHLKLIFKQNYPNEISIRTQANTKLSNTTEVELIIESENLAQKKAILKAFEENGFY